MLNTELPHPPAAMLPFQNAAYALARRCFPSTPIVWSGPYAATFRFDPSVTTDAASAIMYHPPVWSYQMQVYEAALIQAMLRGQRIVAWVSLGAGYAELGDWTWHDPLEYDTFLDYQLGAFLAAQKSTLMAIQLYPPPTDTEHFKKHFDRFMDGWETQL